MVRFCIVDGTDNQKAEKPRTDDRQKTGIEPFLKSTLAILLLKLKIVQEQNL